MKNLFRIRNELLLLSIFFVAEKIILIRSAGLFERESFPARKTRLFLTENNT